MKSKKMVIGVALMMVAGSIALADSAVSSLAEEWKAPERASAKKNPIPSDEKSIAAGKQVYTANCLACHGNAGKGDGPAAVSLPTKPGDLSSAKVQAQSDGALFWKITEGRTPMPSFRGQLSTRQRWEVINYVRTLASKEK